MRASIQHCVGSILSNSLRSPVPSCSVLSKQLFLRKSTIVRIISPMSKGAQTRERIVSQAMRLASRDGLGGLTIGGLADELDMSKSGLFAHFRSKDELQLQVLQAAAARFVETVVRPALQAPRGVPRVRALLERWLAWDADSERLPGGCIFVAAAVELDDHPGSLRDYLAATQRAWLAALARAADIAVAEGHFRADLDREQFAFELYALMLGHHHQVRLLRDPRARERVRTAIERLLHAATSGGATP
jgi:AcrR family transcriptional regulator